MLRDQIKEDILREVRGQSLEVSDEQVEVFRTADAKFGDFSTNIALKIGTKGPKEPKGPNDVKTSGSYGPSGPSGAYHSPLDFAKKLANSLKNQPYVEKLEVAGPGFLNFWIKDSYWQDQVSDVLEKGQKFGSNSVGKGKKARVEFVSANPTGPLHFGNARGGPIGDVLASILEFSGYKVVREYLHNDVGGQVEKLGQSVQNVFMGQKLEDQKYKGQYILDLVSQLKRKIADRQGQTISSMAIETIGKMAVDLLFEEIKEDCRAMGITFDEFYSESEFISGGQTKKSLDKIEKFLKKKDGALWFAPNDEFLNDRETVVVKSDGAFTYFANDIAYHDLKFKDDPALVVDILGANHHGHVSRLQAVVGALGYDVSKFHVILYQWVRFVRKGELVAMSKRSGTFVSAQEVLKEVGKDALRFFILMHDPNSHIDFDLELAREKSKENPVYYVQYAHARICSILAKLETRNKKLETNYKLLTSNYELDLIKQISRLPELVEDVTASFAVHRLTTYATELADSFHRFYENCRVVPTRNASHSDAGGGEKEDLMEARIALISAAKIALANTLKLLGISAPAKM